MASSISQTLLSTLRQKSVQTGGDLVAQLGISRPTLARAVAELGEQVISRGQARRTSYAARRAVRGDWEPLPLYRIDQAGVAHQSATLYPLHNQGFAADFLEAPPWPLDDGMADGWFEGLPYFLDDMRPQGFLGRIFANQYAHILQVSPDPKQWGEDSVIHALKLLGSDVPGNYVLGDLALRLSMAEQRAVVPDEQLAVVYPKMAQKAMSREAMGSSAGGEFPKFTICRKGRNGEIFHAIVKFSGSDDSSGSVRWSDLLVCEHLALQVVQNELGMEAAQSEIFQFESRTFLEVKRFDRIGANGRSPMCSCEAINAALVGDAGLPWPESVQKLEAAGRVASGELYRIERLWHFGNLINNTDMHDGNLSFRPAKSGIEMTPVYDMLPMGYAPRAGVEVPAMDFVPARPLPRQRKAWLEAATAAQRFWEAAAADTRISKEFQAISARNAEFLLNMQATELGHNRTSDQPR